jgi:hypothetical protein
VTKKSHPATFLVILSDSEESPPFSPNRFLIREFLRFAQDSAYGDLPHRNDKKEEILPLRRPFAEAQGFGLGLRLRTALRDIKPLRMTG